MKKYALFVTTVTLMALLQIGCGGSSGDSVAVLDGEKIPVSLIHDFFDKSGWTFESYEKELETKTAAIDSVINYKLLVKGAYEAGLDHDAEIEKLIGSKKVDFLFDALYRRDLAPMQEVTDADVREFYEKIKTERHVYHIMVPTPETADSVLRELDKGADFGTIARLISADQGSAVSGGDLGWMNWATPAVPEFHDEVFRLKVGETSKAVKTQFGYHIIRVLEERPTKLDSFEVMEPTLRQALTMTRTSDAEAKFVSDLQAKAAVEINPDATKMLLDRLNTFYPAKINNVPRPDNFFPDLKLLKPFEQQMVLASYLGGELTIEGYMTKLEEVPEASRPRLDDEPNLKRAIFQLELKNIVEYEAEQRKIQDTDEYQKLVSDFREGLMVDKFVRQIIGQQISANDDEIDQYYNEHLNEFTTPQEYHLLEIQMKDPTELGPIIEKLRMGADFGQLAAQNTLRPNMKEAKGDLGFVQKTRFPALWEAASHLSIGQTSEIVANDQGNYSVIRLLDIKQPIVHPIEQVLSQVQAKVVDLKRSSATVDWLRERRSRSKIEIHADVLEKTIDKAKYANKG
jgi:parvulin-like peptidyl-prolyl isomerase